MFKELFATIAAGFITAMPIAPPMDVVVPFSQVESSVTQYIEKQETRSVTVDCPPGEVTVKANEDKIIACSALDKGTKKTYEMKVTLHAEKEKVTISGIVNKPASETVSSTAKPAEVK